MSHWSNKRNASGETTVTTVPVAGLAVLAFVPGALLLSISVFTLVLNPTLAGALSASLVATGFALFGVAKLHVVRSGQVISWGSRSMAPRFRRFYRSGYVLMILGFLVSLVVLFGTPPAA